MIMNVSYLARKLPPCQSWVLFLAKDTNWLYPTIKKKDTYYVIWDADEWRNIESKRACFWSIGDYTNITITIIPYTKLIRTLYANV